MALSQTDHHDVTEIRSRMRDVVSGVAELARAWPALVVGALICGLIVWLQPSTSQDRRISDRLLTAQQSSADRSYLLVEITPADLREYGRPMLTRENLANTVERLADAGAERVLLDLFLADKVDEAADRKLAQALARLGPQRLALSTSTSPDAQPHEQFARHATLVDGRLQADVDGWHRSLGSEGSAAGTNPASWLASGANISEAIPFDLRIDANRFERASVDDVMRGRVALAGRLVILGASADVAPTRAFLPQATEASRGLVIATAAQSVSQGYPDRFAQGTWFNTAAIAIAVLLGFVVGRIASSGKSLVLISFASLLAIGWIEIGIAERIGVPIMLFTAVSSFFTMLNISLFQRFRIAALVGNFMRGDVSPEEVWAWRGVETGRQPALLFSADGRVKRRNAAAECLSDFSDKELSRKAQPAAGQRAGEIELTRAGEAPRCYEIEWPYDHVPIAILRDVTESRALHENLLEQLFVDELTGCINRRGFEREIKQLVEQGRDYTLFYIDLNGFKLVNDRYGHDVGDKILRVAVQTLRHAVRGIGKVARLGGDEFVILKPGAFDSTAAESLADEIVARFVTPVRLEGQGSPVSIGAAIGYAGPDHAGETYASVMRRADEMMYARKARMKAMNKAA